MYINIYARALMFYMISDIIYSISDIGILLVMIVITIVADISSNVMTLTTLLLRLLLAHYY